MTKTKIITAGKYVQWNITKPLDSMLWYDTVTNTVVPIQESILNSDIGIKNGDVVALLVYDNKPLITKKIKGELLLKNILQAIYKGFNKVLENTSDNTLIVYPIISGYLNSGVRLDKIKKFEDNNLQVKDIVGKHTNFCGVEKINNVWYILLD